MTRQTLIFHVEDVDHEIELLAPQSSETLRQLSAWLPAEITIHCAKIAGCHIYWPSPILARLESATDIHKLPPGSFLYYPDRQYLEIIYDELQAETAAVTYLGRLKDDIDWLREFATRQRREAGIKQFTASLRMKSAIGATAVLAPTGDAIWDRLCEMRRTVWTAEPAEVGKLLQRKGHNIPLGPVATADGYFRFVQESLWQIWNAPDRLNDAQQRAIAINTMELGIARIGHYCHLSDSESFLQSAIACVSNKNLPLQHVLQEVILYCSRMSNWFDFYIPWYEANELAKRALGSAI